MANLSLRTLSDEGKRYIEAFALQEGFHYCQRPVVSELINAIARREYSIVAGNTDCNAVSLDPHVRTKLEIWCRARDISLQQGLNSILSAVLECDRILREAGKTDRR